MANRKQGKKKRTMTAPEPFLIAAFICERVLEESGNVLSAMRIVDRVNLLAEPPSGVDHVALNLTILVAVKSGSKKGKCKIVIVMRTPSKKTEVFGFIEGTLEGDEHGLQIRAPVGFLYEGPGLYWFDIQVNGEIRTSIPLRVVIQKPEPEKPPANK